MFKHALYSQKIPNMGSLLIEHLPKTAIISDDHLSLFQLTIHLAIGAHFMLTVNLSARVDLCNGTVGFVTDLIYGTHTLPNLPVAIMVHFKDYV